MAEKNIMTRAGLQKVEEKLEYLKVVRRPEISEKLQEARAQGDLSENAEYDATMDEQRDLEAEIAALGYQANAVQNQAAALMEVKAGTSDAAVIDALMAAAMIGEGTSYEDLGYTLPLNSEVYGVGFRKGSDLAAELDAFLAAAAEDGSLLALAEAYGVQAALIAE